jgi:hypothetical protein
MIIDVVAIEFADANADDVGNGSSCDSHQTGPPISCMVLLGRNTMIWVAIAMRAKIKPPDATNDSPGQHYHLASITAEPSTKLPYKPPLSLMNP